MWIRWYSMEKETLKIKFEGADEIDLRTLADSLGATITVLEKIADSTLGPNDYGKFKVENVEKGSFEIDIVALVEMSVRIFPCICSLVACFKDILKLRQFLKGEDPAKVTRIEDSVIIENTTGGEINVSQHIINVYSNNPEIEENLAKLSKTASSDNDHNAMTFQFNTKKESEILTYKKDDLQATSRTINTSLLDDTIITEKTDAALLKVKKPDLVSNSKWQFIWHGKTISAEILDVDFLSSVKNGDIQFSAGTLLRAQVITEYKNDKALKYQIVKITEVKDTPS